MKRFLKRLFPLLMCALMLFSTASCSLFSSKEEATDSGEVLTGNYLPTNQLSQYVLIYPERKLTDPLKKKLIELRDLIEEICGVKLDMQDDFVREGTVYTVKRYEILIGATNRSESVDALAHVQKERDYEIRLCGEKLVVGGIAEAANVAAVDRLIQLIRERERADVFFDESMSCSHTDSYELADLTLGDGGSITEYTIVHESSNIGMNLANDLAELITRRTGYPMTVRSTTLDIPDGKCIFVGKTTAPLPSGLSNPDATDQYYLNFSGDDLYLYGATPMALFKAVADLTNAIRQLSAENTAVSPSKGVTLFTDTSLKTMSFNVYYDTSDKTRMANVVTTIRAHMPDTFGVQEATQTWMNYLNDQLGSLYAYVGVGRDSNKGGEHSAVFYRKDKLQLIESGTRWMSHLPEKAGSKVEGAAYPRIFTYALLELKATGQRFLHVNTHTDHVPNQAYDGETIRFKQVSVITAFLKKNYPDVPTILTGDLNDTKSSSSIRHLLSSGFEDAADVAVGTDRTSTFSTRVIDYIMLTKGDFAAYEYKVDVTRYNDEFPSDHRAIVVCFDLK